MRAVLLMGFVLVVGCGKKVDTSAESPRATDSPKPAAKGTPEDWTHKELLSHLNKNGAKVRIVPTTRGTFFGPAAFLVAEESPYQNEKQITDAIDIEPKPKSVAYCQIRKSAQEAKDEAGPLGEKAFSSGRFFFNGTPEMLKRIRVALGL